MKTLAVPKLAEYIEKNRLPVLGILFNDPKVECFIPHPTQAFVKHLRGYGSEVFMIFVPSVLWQIFVGSFFATQPLGH